MQSATQTRGQVVKSGWRPLGAWVFLTHTHAGEGGDLYVNDIRRENTAFATPTALFSISYCVTAEEDTDMNNASSDHFKAFGAVEPNVNYFRR